MKCILFVGHGSRDMKGNLEIKEFVKNNFSLEKYPNQEVCFLEFCEPDIPAGIELCVKRGATHVYVIPIILFPAGHTKLHIPAFLDSARKKHTDVDFVYARPIDVDVRILNILEDRLQSLILNTPKAFDNETNIRNQNSETFNKQKSAANQDTAASNEQKGIGNQEMAVLSEQKSIASQEKGSPDELESIANNKTAVLLVGRGSSDPDANSNLARIARLFWEKKRYMAVEIAFMGITEPLFVNGLDRCRKLGASNILILPYFLFTGVLIERMKKFATEYQSKNSELNVHLGDYMGFHPLLADIISQRIDESMEEAVAMNCDLCKYRIEQETNETIHHYENTSHLHDHHHSQIGHNDSQTGSHHS